MYSPSQGKGTYNTASSQLIWKTCPLVSIPMPHHTAWHGPQSHDPQVFCHKRKKGRCSSRPPWHWAGHYSAHSVPSRMQDMQWPGHMVLCPATRLCLHSLLTTLLVLCLVRFPALQWCFQIERPHMMLSHWCLTVLLASLIWPKTRVGNGGEERETGWAGSRVQWTFTNLKQLSLAGIQHVRWTKVQGDLFYLESFHISGCNVWGWLLPLQKVSLLTQAFKVIIHLSIAQHLPSLHSQIWN